MSAPPFSQLDPLFLHPVFGTSVPRVLILLAFPMPASDPVDVILRLATGFGSSPLLAPSHILGRSVASLFTIG